MKEIWNQDRPVLNYGPTGVPPAERLPRWKVVLIVLFFVPPVVYIVLVLLAGAE